MEPTDTTPTTLGDTEEIVIPQEQSVPVAEKPPARPQNVNVTTLVVDAVRELRVDLGTARVLERIETHNQWQQALIILLVIEQLGILIMLGVLLAR